ncbi:MAG: rhodanese-like domain-containing protein [Shimia sp.]|uniref:rhodanese-like domain-containing protein n=1 Tax=Shimia sp. TaxID=1954381 RepID=UPI003B8CBEDC
MNNFRRTLTAGASLALLPFAVLSATSPETVSGATTVSSEEAGQLFDDGVAFTDVRKPSDFDAGRIPGAVHLDVKSALTQDALAEVVAADAPFVFCCNGHSCMRSSKAAEMAVERSFPNVNYFRDGFAAWEGASVAALQVLQRSKKTLTNHGRTVSWSRTSMTALKGGDFAAVQEDLSSTYNRAPASGEISALVIFDKDATAVAAFSSQNDTLKSAGTPDIVQ